MKAVTIYESREKNDRSGSRLCEKRVIAGMEKAMSSTRNGRRRSEATYARR